MFAEPADAITIVCTCRDEFVGAEIGVITTIIKTICRGSFCNFNFRAQYECAALDTCAAGVSLPTEFE